MSHLLAFIYRVTQLEPRSVTCTMVASPVTGADIHNSAVITCTNGATISLSGTAAVLEKSEMIALLKCIGNLCFCF
jgi:hypothetical protein